jgi:hypothetical protein
VQGRGQCSEPDDNVQNLGNKGEGESKETKTNLRENTRGPSDKSYKHPSTSGFGVDESLVGSRGGASVDEFGRSARVVSVQRRAGIGLER